VSQGGAPQRNACFNKEIAVKIVRALLKSESPYSQSAPVRSEKNTGESNDAFAVRTWREHMHVNGDGEVFIPGAAVKNCLAECAKYLSETVPGKGKATYTKHIEAGVLIPDPVCLGIKVETVEGEKLFLPSDGIRGSGKRVWKTYPLIREWKGWVEIILLDPILIDTPDKIREYLVHAGKFIGLGRFRPRNNGCYGRFSVAKFETT
jgi:hypothetical protein